MDIKKKLLRKTFRAGFTLLVKSSPITASKIIYYKTFRKMLNLKSPKTFNEKLMWLKLYENDTKKTICTDKYLVRNYVRERGQSKILIDLYQVYDSVEEINFEELPNSFVMKCTHGSGFNIVCSNKEKLDKERTLMELEKWMKVDYSLLLGETHYSTIKPRIIVERFLGEEGNENLPIDYKFHCFHGHPTILNIVLDRGTNGKRHIMFNSEWEIVPYTEDSIHFKGEIKKPEKLDEMLSIARELSKEFTYVRVDFYYFNDEIYFGELTFTPGACLDTDYLEGIDYKMGELLDLTALRKKDLSKRLIRN